MLRLDLPFVCAAILLLAQLVTCSPLQGAATGSRPAKATAPPAIRINHLQCKGSHNSYHQQCPAGVFIDRYRYSMPTLSEQLQTWGVRQLELDVHYEKGTGFVVYHAPVIDPNTSCYLLSDCLRQVRDWSDRNPNHQPLFVLMEPKDELDSEKIAGRYDEWERTILSVWPRPRIVAPDDVRGNRPTLVEAVRRDGWPTLALSRGKALFVMLDFGAHQANYLTGAPSLEGRLMFVPAARLDAPFAAVLSFDDPDVNADTIRQAVAAGFIVRTRGDSGVTPNPTRADQAFQLGAHMVSTDFPGPTVDGIEYVLEVPDGTPSRCNPVTAPERCEAAMIEAPPGL